MSENRTLLYFCDSSKDGIADYAHFQMKALAALGVRITLLADRQWRHNGHSSYELWPKLPNKVAFRPKYRTLQRISTGFRYLRQFQILGDVVRQKNFTKVLLSSFTEYMAPIWSKQFVNLARRGVRFGAIAHDPVRDYVVGPRWWHNWSVACGYSFLSEAFVHENIQLQTLRPMPRLQTSIIPFGVYPFAPSSLSRDAARKKYQLPENAKVLLAFGHIRDNKNLDLVMRAMSGFSDLYLLVAGKAQAAGHRPIAFYQSLALELGIAERCRWVCDYIPECEVGNLFLASDLTVLCYSRKFRSASSALNVAVNYRKPCLASSGEGNLKTMVSHYQLGIWVEPDNIDSLVEGISLWLRGLPPPHWEAYETENSWRKNAEIVATRMNLLPG